MIVILGMPQRSELASGSRRTNMHRYDHNCTCEACRNHELRLKAMVQEDRAKDRAKDVRAYEERQKLRRQGKDQA